jgi:type VI secretion system secreted protein VgrG
MLDQTPRIAAITTPLGENTLVLRGMSVTEALGRLPSFELQLLSEEETIDPRELLGKTATIRLNVGHSPKPRFFHGYMIQFGRSGVQDRYFAYQATMVPWLWFLTRTTNCRIYQQQTVPQIIEKIFKEHAFEFQPRLSGNYTPWEYCVQYRESDFNFVSRLMEQEGIYYYFQHEETKHVLILADSLGSHDPLPGYDQISWRAPGQHGDQEGREHVRDFVTQMNHLSGVFTHTDFDFTRPRVDLKTSSEIPGEYARPKGEVYDYPGEYVLHDDGEAWARTRMEEIHAQIEMASGWGDTRGLAAGCVFTLTDPCYPEQGGRYLVTSVRHALLSNEYETGRKEEAPPYGCQFLAQPAERVYRPARITPKPRTYGVQTAIIVGPKGSEIYNDEYGRVKVHFHWDRYDHRDENSSCWIRVAQIWAGWRWGATFTPRVGQEVIVDFLEGDPDQPIIIGSVYNGVQMPPYLGKGFDPKHKNDPNVSGIKSCSTKGGQGYNELRFDDTKGKEQIFIHAEKDIDTRVRSDTRTDVGGSINLIVGFQDKSGELHGFVKEKIFRTKITHALKTVAVQADAEHVIYVGKQGEACKQIMVESGEMRTTAEKLFSVKTPATIVLDGGAEICLTCGPSFIKLTPAGIFINGPMVYINSGGESTSGSDVTYLAPLEPNAADDSKSGFPSAPPPTQ